MTTRADAIKALGPPSSVYQAANGEKTLSWARDGGLFAGDETHQYAVVFGPDDKMVRVASDALKRHGRTQVAGVAWRRVAQKASSAANSARPAATKKGAPAMKVLPSAPAEWT